MTTQQFAIQTAKSIEATAKTHDTFKYGRVKNLAKSLVALGYGFLLFDLSPIAAQTVALVGISPTTNEVSVSKRRKVVAGTCFTGEKYTMKDGNTLDVYQNEAGKRFVIRVGRDGKARRYYPTRLNAK